MKTTSSSTRNNGNFSRFLADVGGQREAISRAAVIRCFRRKFEAKLFHAPFLFRAKVYLLHDFIRDKSFRDVMERN